jgi:hypothetical protein
VADLVEEGFSKVTIARALGQEKLQVSPRAVTVRTLWRLRLVQRRLAT